MAQADAKPRGRTLQHAVTAVFAVAVMIPLLLFVYALHRLKALDEPEYQFAVALSLFIGLLGLTLFRLMVSRMSDVLAAAARASASAQMRAANAAASAAAQAAAGGTGPGSPLRPLTPVPPRAPGQSPFARPRPGAGPAPAAKPWPAPTQATAVEAATPAQSTAIGRSVPTTPPATSQLASEHPGETSEPAPAPGPTLAATRARFKDLHVPGLGPIDELHEMADLLNNLWKVEAEANLHRRVQVAVQNAPPVVGTLTEVTEEGIVVDDNGLQTGVIFRRILAMERLH